MATLDQLVKIDGVVLAFEFASDGKLVNYKANVEMSSEMPTMTVQSLSCKTVRR